MDSITVYSSTPKAKIDIFVLIIATVIILGMQSMFYFISIDTSIYINIFNIPIIVMGLILVYKTRKLSYNKLTVTQKDIKGEYGDKLFYGIINDTVQIIIKNTTIQLKINKKKYSFTSSQEDITRLEWFIKRYDLRCLNEDLGNREGFK